MSLILNQSDPSDRSACWWAKQSEEEVVACCYYWRLAPKKISQREGKDKNKNNSADYPHTHIDMSPITASNSRLNTSIATVAFVLPIIYIYRRNKIKARAQKLINQEREQERAFLSSLVKNPYSQPLRPPLPEIVQRVLSRCSLAYLSTIDIDSTSSHLSLMRFTYLPEEETIVMSTNVNTKKYDMLEKQNGVALLIHDFGDGENNLTGEYSITLNGTCSVVKDGKRDRGCASNPLQIVRGLTMLSTSFSAVVLAEKYRSAHLKNNPDYPQVSNEVYRLCKLILVNE